MLGHILRPGRHTRIYVIAARFLLKKHLQMDPHFRKETAGAGRTGPLMDHSLSSKVHTKKQIPLEIKATLVILL